MDLHATGVPATGRRRALPWLWMVATFWICGAAGGLSILWRFDNTPGVAASPSSGWPSDSRLSRSTGGLTLVILAHPQCSCTRASLGELAEVIERALIRPKTYVVFLKPLGVADGWERTDLWKTAAGLRDVTVVQDDDGREARAFGAATSGQTLLYDAGGSLLFTGGITGARAHPGDNLGRRALIALLNGQQRDRAGSNVFGCPLFTTTGN